MIAPSDNRKEITSLNSGIYTIDSLMAVYFQPSMLIPQVGSGLPRKRCPNVHDWGQRVPVSRQKSWRFHGIYQALV
jgi:hypothetical protein